MLQLEQFRQTLTNKIERTTELDEIEGLVANAVMNMNANRVNGYIIARFLDKLIGYFSTTLSTDPPSKQHDLSRGIIQILACQRNLVLQPVHN